MALCEVALSNGSDLLAEEIKFGLGWNSTSTTDGSKAVTCTGWGWIKGCFMLWVRVDQRLLHVVGQQTCSWSSPSSCNTIIQVKLRQSRLRWQTYWNYCLANIKLSINLKNCNIVGQSNSIKTWKIKSLSCLISNCKIYFFCWVFNIRILPFIFRLKNFKL